jgi:hypothetical protein
MICGDGEEYESGSDEFSRKMEGFRKNRDAPISPSGESSGITMLIGSDGNAPGTELPPSMEGKRVPYVLSSDRGSMGITMELSYTRSGGEDDGVCSMYPIETFTDDSLDILKNAQKGASITIGVSGGKVDIREREARTPSPSRTESSRGRGT